ncbi:unnamed protein product [Penicillium viridicatum]
MPPRKRASPPSAESHTGKKARTPTYAATQQLPPGPACPGEVKTRERGVRAAKDLSDEEAFLELLATFDIPSPHRPHNPGYPERN